MIETPVVDTFAPDEGEFFLDLNAEVRVAQREEQRWCYGATATLPEAQFTIGPLSEASRSGAITQACETLITWCGEQKAKGSRKHRKQADEIQDWALSLAKQHATPEPEPALAVNDTGTADDALSRPMVEVMRQMVGTPTVDEIFEMLETPAVQSDVAALTEKLAATSPIAGLAPVLYPVDQLYPSPHNPRRLISASGIDKMAESMRAEGFRPWSPIIARIAPIGGVVAAGHRRRLAAMRAGLTHVPVILVEMTDEQYDEILAFENGNREEIHPLHEALGWQDWRTRRGAKVEDIAARTGLGTVLIYKRLKCCELIEAGQKLWLDGIIQEGHAVQIARLSERQQRDAVHFCTPPDHNPDRRVSVRELAKWIKDRCYKSLSDAPFSAFDATLPILKGGPLMEAFGENAGSCIECPKQSGNDYELFLETGSADVCTDAKCYDGKVKAHEAREQIAAEEREAERVRSLPVEDDIKSAPKPAPKPKPAPRDPAAEAEHQAALDREREMERAAEQERAKERERLRLQEVRTQKVYEAAVKTICAKVNGPLSPEDGVSVLMYVATMFDCGNELAVMFDIKGGPIHQVIAAGAPRMNAAKVTRMILAGILLDEGYQNGFTSDALLKRVAKSHGVKLDQVAKVVDAEIAGYADIRKLNPPPTDARKDAIGKLGTLADEAGTVPGMFGRGPAAAAAPKAPNPPAKKAAPVKNVPPAKKAAPKPAKKKADSIEKPAKKTKATSDGKKKAVKKAAKK